MRQIVLDTETTGLEVGDGERIIEIGAVELENRRLTGRHYHQFVNPEGRAVSQGALAVHGISDEFLADKPVFAQVAADFLEFVDGAELIIHNAPFDLGFLNAELTRIGRDSLKDRCSVIDTLVMARRLHPGQRNTLDALCGRYHVDNSNRELHGALLDSEILADVYLAMTGGQTKLALGGQGAEQGRSSTTGIRRLAEERPLLPVSVASAEEIEAHEAMLETMRKRGANVVWEEGAAG